MLKKALEIIASIALFFIAFQLYQGQERIILNSGHGWDGESYFQAAQQVADGIFPIVGEPPFINRVGLHLLVGTYAKLTQQDIIQSALEINLTAIFLTTLLLMIWLQFFIKSSATKLFLISLYLFVWHSGLRNIFFDTIIPDPCGGVFFLLGLIGIVIIKKRFTQKRPIALSIILYAGLVLLGSLFRESIAAFAIAIFFITSPIKSSGIHIPKLDKLTFSNLSTQIKNLASPYFTKDKLVLFVPLLGIIGSKIIIHYCIAPTDFTSYSYPQALARWFYSKSCPEFIVGTCLSFGPLLLLIPFYYNKIRLWLSDKEEITMLLFMGIFFGYFGGGDTERILFMSTFPIIFVMLSFAIQDLWKKHKLVLFALIALQSFAYRVYWFLPNYPNNYTQKPIPFFGLIGEKFDHLLLYSTHGNIYINSVIFVEYAMLLVGLFFILHKKQLKTH